MHEFHCKASICKNVYWNILLSTWTCLRGWRTFWKIWKFHPCMHAHTYNDIYTAIHIDSVWLHRLYCSCIFSTDCCLSHAQNRNVFWQQEMETNLILWTSFFQNLEFVKRWKHEHSEEIKCRQGLSTRKHCLPRIMSLMPSTGSNRGRKENINGEKLETEKREKKKLSYSYLNQLAMIKRERQIKAGYTPFFPLQNVNTI